MVVTSSVQLFITRVALGAMLIGNGCAAGPPPVAEKAAAAAIPGRPASPATPAAPATGQVMRAYDTPPGRAAELASVLQRAMRGGGDTPRIGNATALDGDRVVVVAPPGVHAGIEPLCAKMRDTGTLPATSVQISYWLVRADPAEATDTSALPALAETLTEVAEQTGPAIFSLTEKASLSSMLNAHARTHGLRAEFSQVATAHEGGVVADLEIKLSRTPHMGGELHTRVAVAPGETVVVGQNGLGDDDDARLFYVIRAELVDAT